MKGEIFVYAFFREYMENLLEKLYERGYTEYYEELFMVKKRLKNRFFQLLEHAQKRISKDKNKDKINSSELILDYINMGCVLHSTVLGMIDIPLQMDGFSPIYGNKELWNKIGNNIMTPFIIKYPELVKVNCYWR